MVLFVGAFTLYKLSNCHHRIKKMRGTPRIHRRDRGGLAIRTNRDPIGVNFEDAFEEVPFGHFTRMSGHSFAE